MLPALGALFLAAIALAIVAPTSGRAGLRPAIAVIVALVVVGAIAAWSLGDGSAGAGRIAAAAGVLATFGAALAALGRALPGVAAPGIVAIAALVWLAGPFVVDPFLEAADGSPRPLALVGGVTLNPIAAIASPLLGVDWLRAGVMYGDVRIGAFHRFAYPSPLVHALGWSVLALVASFAAVRRESS